MPYAPHRRLSFIGIFGGVASPIEQWSFRLNMGDQVLDESPGAALASAETAFATHLAPRLKQMARLTAIKYAVIGPDGKYVGNPTERSVNVAGSGTTGEPHAPQIALGVSLGTGVRGASYRGRIFLPAPHTYPDAGTGLIPSAWAQDTANSAASFISALNAISPLGSVVIASNKGFNTEVLSVRVGRVLDTIRSRRSSIKEGYVSNVTAVTLGG